MSKRSSKLKTAVMVILVIILLILSLGLLGRLTNVFGNKITVRYNGTKITKDFEGLEIESGTEIEVRAPGEYEVKIYAAGTEATDFTFTVGGTEYSWQKDIAGANGGRGEDFTDAFEVTQTESGFTISCGVEKALRDIWQDEAIVLPENIPEGDRFRMEIRSGKNTLTVSFSVKEPGSVGVEKIELAPGEIVF